MHVSHDVYTPSSLNQPLIYGDLIYLSLPHEVLSASKYCSRSGRLFQAVPLVGWTRVA